jgi:hypothetical protein
MALPFCPYCKQPFTPSRYRPDQVVCSAPQCQRQRRTDYHRQRLNDDSSYRAQCRDSQQQWREQHPNYMREYRRARALKPAKAVSTKFSSGTSRLLELIKNNVALDLNSCAARVWLISPDEVKNFVAKAEIILVKVLPGSL